MSKTAYTPGGVSKLLAEVSKSSTPKNERLDALFSTPTVWRPQRTESSLPKSAKRSRTESAVNSPAITDSGKTKRKRASYGAELLHNREELLQNADDEYNDSVLKKKMKKQHQKPREDDDDAVELELDAPSAAEAGKMSKIEMNRANARGRVEAKRKWMQNNVTEAVRGERTVFVGNVALSVTKKKLLKLFRTAGEVESVRMRSVPVADLKLPKKAEVIMKDFHPQRHNMNAYIVFKDAEAATKSLKLNGMELGGTHLRVDLAPMGNKHDHRRSVFLGNLPFDVEEEPLRKHFEDCGAIDNIRIVRDRTTLLGKGFGFITFRDAASVGLALSLHNEPFLGRPLRVQRSSEDPSTKSKSANQQRRNFPRSQKLQRAGSRQKSDPVEKRPKFGGKKKQKISAETTSSPAKTKVLSEATSSGFPTADAKKRRQLLKKKRRKKQQVAKKKTVADIFLGSRVKRPKQRVNREIKH